MGIVKMGVEYVQVGFAQEHAALVRSDLVNLLVRSAIVKDGTFTVAAAVVGTSVVFTVTTSAGAQTVEIECGAGTVDAVKRLADQIVADVQSPAALCAEALNLR